MLNFTLTRIASSFERPVSAGASIAQEGSALIASYVGGQFGVINSTGSGNEIFQGVALNMLKPVLRIPTMEQYVAPGSGIVTVNFIPLGSSVRVFDVTDNAAVAGVTTSGTSVICGVGTAGHVLQIAYSYAPTVQQAQLVYGNVHPGGAAGDYLGQVGVIEKGDVFTTEYDSSADWALTVVRLGASGRFTTSGSGTILTNVTVIAQPSVGSGFLGLSIK